MDSPLSKSVLVESLLGDYLDYLIPFLTCISLDFSLFANLEPKDVYVFLIGFTTP